MRAIILATGEKSNMEYAALRMPPPLLPVADRPFVRHLADFLTGQGIRRIDFIFREQPEEFKSCLGDGSEWGATFSFHLSRADDSLPERLRVVQGGGDDDWVLVGHADLLPHIDVRHTRPQNAADAPVLFTIPDRPGASEAFASWSGWAWLRPAHFASMPDRIGTDELYELRQAFGVLPMPVLSLARVFLNVRSFEAYLEASRTVLDLQFAGLPFNDRPNDRQVWLSRDVSLHPTVSIIPPVFVGAGSTIGPGVRLGPYAVIGEDCELDESSSVENSVVFSRSFIGEGLECRDVVINRNRLVNVRFQAAVTINDDVILRSIEQRTLRALIMRILSRTAAFTFLLVMLPLLAATAIVLKVKRSGSVAHKRAVLQLPAEHDEAAWRTCNVWTFLPEEDNESFSAQDVSWRSFLLAFLPGLLSVVRGDIRFVGVPPRSPEAVHALPPDWREIYLQAKAGLVTEAQVISGASADTDELYSAEALYAVTTGLRHDFVLLSRYFLQLLFPLLR